MPTLNVKVKWGKQVFDSVDVDTDQPPIVFKSQLFALTNVPPDRQKVMMKGGILKDDDWGNVVVKKNMTIMMMG